MYSAANDNSQLYPEKSGGGGTSGDVAAILLAGGYISDATIFSLSGDTNTSFKAVSSITNTATSIAAAQVSWDFMNTSDGAGVSSTSYPYLPIVWSTINGGTEPTFSENTGPMVATPTTANPFSTDGVAVFYINNSAAFNPSTVTGAAGTSQVNMVSAANNLGKAPTNYVPAKGT